MCCFPSNSDNTEDKESGIKEESSGKSVSVPLLLSLLPSVFFSHGLIILKNTLED